MKYKKTFTLRLNEPLLNKLHYASDINKRSVNNQIEVIIEQFIKDFEKEHGLIPQVDDL